MTIHPGAEAILYADGGSRGNPGPAASAAILYNRNGKEIKRLGVAIGNATSNVAEWNALCLGLETAIGQSITRLSVRMDSLLVVEQIRGRYQVKHPNLKLFHKRAIELLDKFEFLDIQHIPREENTVADSIVNETLDALKPRVHPSTYESIEIDHERDAALLAWCKENGFDMIPRAAYPIAVKLFTELRALQAKAAR